MGCPSNLVGRNTYPAGNTAASVRTAIRNFNQIAEERQIVARIRAGDPSGAREPFTGFLGRILLSPGVDLEEARVRVAELLIVASRAVIESGGADETVLQLNAWGLKNIMSTDSPRTLYSWACTLFDQLLEYVGRAAAPADCTVVSRACEVMNTRYREKLSVKDIARSVYVSPHHLCRLFRRELAQSVMERLTEIRVARARELLETTNLRISDIARLVGLTNSAHFCRVFKRCTGMPPAQYRRQFGGGLPHLPPAK